MPENFWLFLDKAQKNSTITFKLEIYLYPYGDFTRQPLCLVAQWCLTLCNPMDCIGHQVPLSVGILQGGKLEWVSVPFSKGSSQPRDRTQFSSIAAKASLSVPPGKPKITFSCRHSFLSICALRAWLSVPQFLND